jgi:hypothetical protein
MRKNIGRTRIACWITKATNTHSQYVTLTVYTLQQRLQQHPSMLHSVLFFLGGRRGTRTPKHFVNLTGESKNFIKRTQPHASLEVIVSCVI